MRPLETTVRDVFRVVHRGVETLWMDATGCIPFSVRDANAWVSVDLNHPAKIVLYKVEKANPEDLGLHPINGKYMGFPRLDYVNNGDGLKAVLGEPEFKQ